MSLYCPSDEKLLFSDFQFQTWKRGFREVEEVELSVERHYQKDMAVCTYVEIEI